MEITLDMGVDYWKAQTLIIADIGTLRTLEEIYKLLHETLTAYNGGVSSVKDGWLELIGATKMLIARDIKLSIAELENMPKEGSYTFTIRASERNLIMDDHTMSIADFMSRKRTVPPVKPTHWPKSTIVALVAGFIVGFIAYGVFCK